MQWANITLTKQMIELNTTINGRNVRIVCITESNYFHVIATLQGQGVNILYSVIDGVSDNAIEVINGVKQTLENKLK